MLNRELVPVLPNPKPRSPLLRMQISGRDALAIPTMLRGNRDQATYADDTCTCAKGILPNGIGIVNKAASGSFKEPISSNTGKFERIVTGGTGVLLLLVYAVSAVTLYHWASPL